MADPVKPAQTPSQSVAGQGGIGGTPDPQNVNRSPSPGGDGIQSSASERQAGGDTSLSQPVQQRVNAAERREQGDRVKHGDKVGERSTLIQSPGMVQPGEASAAAINDAEKARNEAAERAHTEQFKDLPEATLTEMEAGKAALKRHARAPEPTNPVDDLEARKSA